MAPNKNRGTWATATAVTNKHNARTSTTHSSRGGSNKATQRKMSTPEPSPGPKGKNQSRAQGQHNGSHDEGNPESESENIRPPKKTNRKKHSIVFDEDEDEDGNKHEDTFPSSDTLRSSDSTRPNKKTKASPMPNPKEPNPEHEMLPFLIAHAGHLNIDDKDAVRKASGVYDFYDKYLNAYRMCGAYVNLEAAYLRGAELLARDDYQPDVGGSILDDDVYFYQCHILLNEWLSPELPDAQEYFHEYPDAAVKILQYVDAAAARGRSNDMGWLRNSILDFAGIKTMNEVRHLQQRGNRGFNHPTTARLLVPMNKLKEFCRKVLENEDGYRFKANRWPLFLYDDKMHTPGKMHTGLFRSRFLLACFLLIFCGPTAVNEELDDGMQSQGTPPLYQHYQLKHVTVEQIVYVACLVRSLLSSQIRWKARDGPWIGKDFALSLLHIFYRNLGFMNETLQWWDKHVYGDRFDEDNDGSDCEAAMLLEEEAQEREEYEQYQAHDYSEGEDRESEDCEGEDRDARRHNDREERQAHTHGEGEVRDARRRKDRKERQAHDYSEGKVRDARRRKDRKGEDRDARRCEDREHVDREHEDREHEDREREDREQEDREQEDRERKDRERKDREREDRERKDKDREARCRKVPAIQSSQEDDDEDAHGNSTEADDAAA